MKEPIAYFNGSFAPFSSVSISLADSGFVMGTSVAEQLRTFGGRLFRLEDHLRRLARSLEIVGVSMAESLDRLAEIGRELVAHNHPLLDQGDDLGLAIIVTPGVISSYGPADLVGATVCLHTYPLSFALWHEKYEQGQSLVVPEVRQVPGVCWPSALKCRSRMHYHLADCEAAVKEPGARALLLDTDGHVTEASTANVLLYRDQEGLVSPPHDKVLPGISLAEVVELGEPLGAPLTERDMTPDYVRAADEVFLTSTPLCILPVVSLDGHKIGSGRPGSFFRRLIEAWNEAVGLDIVAQAHRFAGRR
jgi:branched-subunit amino acid aminotransferase/4-amino-4-deoxychorismate lyase